MTLTIKRGDDSPFDLAITRDVIQQQEVVSEDLAEGTVGYIRLSGFSDTGAAEVADAPSRRTSTPGGRSSSSTCAAIPAGS